MKHMCRKTESRAAALVIFSLVFAVLTAAAVYCVHKFLLDNKDDYYDEDEDEEYIDENGVCYTDEKNFVD